MLQEFFRYGEFDFTVGILKSGEETLLFNRVSRMWQRLTNSIQSLKTYGDLSPDLRLRCRINRVLRDRPRYRLDRWYQTFWQPLGVSSEIAEFVYQQMETYSGLTFAHVLPSDRLTEDLSLPLVCWFDWESTLCDDFYDRFGVDISSSFDVCELATIQELVVFINQQSRLVNYS